MDVNIDYIDIIDNNNDVNGTEYDDNDQEATTSSSSSPSLVIRSIDTTPTCKLKKARITTTMSTKDEDEDLLLSIDNKNKIRPTNLRSSYHSR